MFLNQVSVCTNPGCISSSWDQLRESAVSCYSHKWTGREQRGSIARVRPHSPSIMAGSKLVLEGRVSLNAFILGLGVVLIPLIRTWFGHLDWVFDYLTETPGKVAICVYVAVINGLLLLIYRGPLYKVSSGVSLPLPVSFHLFLNKTQVFTAFHLQYFIHHGLMQRSLTWLINYRVALLMSAK